MDVLVERIVGWDRVLNDARITVGKVPIKKEPSDDFKKKILASEHSPVRNLLYSITWSDIPYWVAMHLRTHHIGFKSSDDDLYFIETQRSDRTQRDRNDLKQTAKVTLSAQINAQTLINVSRVRLCRQASKETLLTWKMMLKELKKIEPFLYSLCVPNCVYRNGICPENVNCCGYNKTSDFKVLVDEYRQLF